MTGPHIPPAAARAATVDDLDPQERRVLGNVGRRLRGLGAVQVQIAGVTRQIASLEQRRQHLLDRKTSLENEVNKALAIIDTSGGTP